MAMKLTLMMLLLAACLAVVYAKGDCPSASKNLNCTPRCANDGECSSNGGRCCPNLCNTKSCAAPHLLSNAGGGGGSADNTSPFSKSSSTSGASGSYCGNTKCSTFEKCQMDRSTARPKCVRT